MRFNAITYWYKFKYKIISCFLVMIGIYLQFNLMVDQFFYGEDVNSRQILAVMFFAASVISYLNHYQETQIRKHNYKKDVFDKKDAVKLREKLIKDMALAKKDDKYAHQVKARINENYRTGDSTYHNYPRK